MDSSITVTTKQSAANQSMNASMGEETWDELMGFSSMLITSNSIILQPPKHTNMHPSILWEDNWCFQACKNDPKHCMALPIPKSKSHTGGNVRNVYSLIRFNLIQIILSKQTDYHTQAPMDIYFLLSGQICRFSFTWITIFKTISSLVTIPFFPFAFHPFPSISHRGSQPQEIHSMWP